MSDQKGFHFSMGRITEAEKDLDMQISAVEAHIDKLIKAAEIRGHPVLSYTLQLSHDADDLKRLAESLKLVAPHVEKLDMLKKRKAVFEAAATEPMWFEWAFSDAEFPEHLDAHTIETLNQ